jgi:hypothetical protein
MMHPFALWGAVAKSEMRWCGRPLAAINGYKRPKPWFIVPFCRDRGEKGGSGEKHPVYMPQFS